MLRNKPADLIRLDLANLIQITDWFFSLYLHRKLKHLKEPRPSRVTHKALHHIELFSMHKLNTSNNNFTAQQFLSGNRKLFPS